MVLRLAKATKPRSGLGLIEKESQVLKVCLDYLHAKGYIVIRNNSGKVFLSNENGSRRMVRFGDPGSPDIIACSPTGQFVAVECKGPRGTITPSQKDYIKRLKRSNEKVVVARCVEDLIANNL